ncbi:MAG TPA: c-type cytochrome [Candidatus Limnocylindrales bacterium]|nr:c-type cytochrome [Candidatus Limnocylindrales bacterium]
MNTLKGIVAGILLGLVLAICGIYFYFAGGHAPVATKGPEMPFEHKLSHLALDAYLNKLPHPNPPVPANDQNFLEGVKVYKENCAVCHGLPDEPKSAIAAGMFPPPPQLFHGNGVTDDEPWETYWKVSGGIRMTGMPGYSERLSETKMWQVSLLLKNADKISPTVKAALVGGAASPTAAAPAPAPATPVAAEPAHH